MDKLRRPSGEQMARPGNKRKSLQGVAYTDETDGEGRPEDAALTCSLSPAPGRLSIKTERKRGGGGESS